MAHATKRAPPLHTIAPSVPASLVAIVDRCLEKRAEDRFPNCEMLADALDDALEAVPSTIQSLPEGMPPVISESQAAAIWQRAARLQADALQRLEQRNDLMPTGTSVPTSAADPSGGYKLVDVATAAEEAGISRQYVAMALAEIPRGGLAVESTSADQSERVATRYLGTMQRSLAVSVTLHASPARALRALGAALPQAPYSLAVRETIGAHPLDGGVIVFDLPAGLVTGETLNYWMGLRNQLEARQVQVTLRPLPGDPTRTEVTMTADLRPGVRRNVSTSKWIAGVLGGVTGGIGTAILIKGAAAALLGVAGAGGVAVAAAIGGTSLLGYRSLYRSTVNKARGEMLRALESIAATMRAEDVFGAPIAGTPASIASPRTSL
jgi:hypothetical protein